MNIKKIIIIVVLVLGFGSTYAQTQNDANYNKYWYYRYRLIKDFMIVGLDQGMSIPASARNIDRKDFGPENNTNGTLQWVDATCLLGDYIGVLATELNLVMNKCGYTNGQGVYENKMRTEYELFCAMKAFERLDKKAENMLDKEHDVGDRLNGFFIRDDVPRDFIISPDKAIQDNIPLTDQRVKNWHSLNSGLTKPPGRNYSSVDYILSNGETIIEKSGITNNPRSDLNQVEVSKDQIVHIVMGLCCVMRFVDPNESWYDPTTGTFYNFVAEAKANYNRILGHISSFNNWFFKEPIISNYTFSGQAILNDAKDAAGCSDYSFAFMQVVMKYQTGFFGGSEVGVAKWFGIPALGCNLRRMRGQWHMPLGMAAVSAGWDASFRSADLSQRKYNTTAAVTYTRGICPTEEVELYNLLLSAIYGPQKEKYMIPKSRIDNLLANAPCYGPYNYSYVQNGSFNPRYDSYYWSLPKTFVSPHKRGINLAAFGGNPGEYNGIDFMLFYNLALINYNTNIPSTGYNNNLEAYVNSTYPMGQSTGFRGSTSKPERTTSYMNLTSVEKIITTNPNDPSQQGNVTYQAGERINLKVGFKVYAGSYFHAKVDPLNECVDGGKTYQSPELYSENSIQHYSLDSILSVEMQDTILQNGMDSFIEPSQLKAYPNPFHNEITVEMPEGCGGDFDLYILSATGSVVFYKSVLNIASDKPNSLVLDGSKLSAGIYTVYVRSKDVVLYTNLVKLD